MVVVCPLARWSKVVDAHRLGREQVAGDARGPVRAPHVLARRRAAVVQVHPVLLVAAAAARARVVVLDRAVLHACSRSLGHADAAAEALFHLLVTEMWLTRFC